MKQQKRRPTEEKSRDVLEAVYYARVSDKEQEEGYSIPAQVRAAKAYAANQGFRIIEEFVDIETARKTGRPQFNKMMSFLRKSKKPLAVVVEKTDRLYRNLKDYTAMDDLVSEKGIEIHLYKEGMNLTKDARSQDKFIHGIRVLMAKNFIDNLSEEVKKGMTEKARQGHYPQAAPIGYLNNPVTRLIDVDPVRAPIVKRLFDLYATGEYSISDLRKEAKAAGLTNNQRTQQPLGTSAIDRMLDNPIYTGTFRWSGALYQGKHTPLITKELWERVQVIKHGRSGGIYQDREFAFTGLMICGQCGCAITAERKKERYTYYRCTGGKGSCPNKSKNVREEVIDKQLSQVVAALKLDDRVFESLKVGLKSSFEDEQAFIASALANLGSQEAKLKGRLNQIYLDKLDGNIAPETYQELKERFEQGLDNVREQIAAHQSADRKYLEYGVRLLELAQTAYSSYIQRSPMEKRRLLNFVLSNCVLDDGQVTPTYRQPFDLIASAAAMSQKGSSLDLSDPGYFEAEYPRRESNPSYHLERVTLTCFSGVC